MSFFDEELDPEPVKRRHKFAWGTVLTIVTSLAIIALSVLPTPYVIERPGGAYNVLGQDHGSSIITVTNAKTYDTDGALDLLTVEIVGSPKQTPSWFDLFLAWLNPSQSILPLDLIFPPTQTQSQTEQQSAEMFTDSQSNATAAALTELGYSYEIQLFVAGLADGAAATGKLQTGDQVVALDGTAVTSYNQLTSTIQAGQGAEIAITVIGSDGVERIEKVTPKLIDNTYRVGAFINATYKFPVNVKLQLQDIGGPSGGMMFALGIYDKLTPGFLNGGKIIAGTGTIDATGEVGPIGGIRAKLYSARDAGAQWFLAPSSNCDEVVGHIPSDIQVTKVNTLKEAIAAVEAIASGDTASLPTCSAN